MASIGLLGLLVVSHAAAQDDKQFLRLEPGVKLPTQACPIRVELPLDQVLKTKGGELRSGRAAGIVCSSAYLQLIEVKFSPAKNGLEPQVHVSTHVGVRPGVDKIVTVDYTVVQGDKVLGTGGESLRCDEGETNWEDGAVIPFPQQDPGLPLLLRIEATVADNP